MDDLKVRIKDFLNEIEHIHVGKTWFEYLLAVGIDRKEANIWAAEIGHVIEEYQRSLRRLADLLQETDPQRIPLQVHEWAVGRLEVTIPEIEDAMRSLEGHLEKYLPPEPEDEDEPS